MEDAPEPSMQLLAEAAQNQSPLPDLQSQNLLDHDDRSSSLSDVEDRPVTQGTDAALDKSSQLSEEEDTEAETERLGESPDKSRKQKNVLLSATDVASNGASTPSGKPSATASGSDLPLGIDSASREELHSDPLDHTSPISSLEESPDEASGANTPSSSSSRKRKREDEERTNKSLKEAALQLLANQAGDNNVEKMKDSMEFMVTSANGRQIVGQEEMLGELGADSPPDALDEQANEEDVEPEDAAESNDEDVDMEDAGQEADASARNEEELARKKSALDLLGKIENDFALLRDRLFADRTQKLNEELASLESDNITHPDYLSMMAAIEAQRKERVELARTSFRFKVKALQNKSIGDRTICLSQYMQSAREIRDKALEHANHEWYNIQRGRRALEEGLVERVSMTSVKRSDLVAQQNAYNIEVSILSGMAKFVGFPAAPEVTGASQSETDDDLRKMGISLQPQQQSHVSSSMAAHYLRQSLAGEKQFSKVTPWANAQHPHHSHPLNAPQHWNSARTDSPFTPASQSNAIAETNLPNGSTSTIAAPTPLSSELVSSNPQPLSRIVSDVYGETPSRLPQQPPERPPPRSEDYPVDRSFNEATHYVQSSPLSKGPSGYLGQSDSAPRALKSPAGDRRAMGPPPPNEDAIGASAAENRMPTAPGLVKVGMA